MARSRQSTIASQQTSESYNAALPDGWMWIRLPELVDELESGSRPKGGVRGINDGVPSIGGEHLAENGRFDFTNIRYVPEEFASKMARGWIKQSDVLIVKDGATTGKTSFVEKTFPFAKALLNEHVFRVRGKPERIEQAYLFRFLSSQIGQTMIDSAFRGSAQGRINQTFVDAVTLPLPPLPQQRRIVARIESLFAESRTARDALERVPTLLKRFRQSILASAFRGDLTERDPNDEPASTLLERIRAERVGATLGGRPMRGCPQQRGIGQPHRVAPTVAPAPDTPDLPELPAGWAWVRLGEYADYITKGESPKWQGYDYVEKGVPFVRSENVLWGELKYSTAVKIPEKFHQKLVRSQLQPSDVLINLVGASIGRSAIVPKELERANINQAVGLIRLNKSLSPEYLMHLLISPFIQDVIHGEKADVARANFGLDDLRVLRIPLAPLAEQRRIVAKIELLFAQADAIERAVTIARQRADKVDQAILARAFRGEL